MQQHGGHPLVGRCTAAEACPLPCDGGGSTPLHGAHCCSCLPPSQLRPASLLHFLLEHLLGHLSQHLAAMRNLIIPATTGRAARDRAGGAGRARRGHRSVSAGPQQRQHCVWLTEARRRHIASAWRLLQPLSQPSKDACMQLRLLQKLPEPLQSPPDSRDDEGRHEAHDVSLARGDDDDAAVARRRGQRASHLV